MPYFYRTLKQQHRVIFFSRQSLLSILHVLGTLLTLGARLWLMLQPGGTPFPPPSKSTTFPRPSRTRT
jgi:hypothetical protein